MIEFSEKTHKRVRNAGAAGLVVGISLIVFGISLGVVSIVFGAHALQAQKDLLD